MKRLIRTTVAAVSILGVGVPGMVAAHNASIGTTGPDSYNTIKYNHDTETTVDNDNTIGVSSNVSQSADSGDVTVRRNTTSDGDAGSGNASNSSSLSLAASVSNNSGAWAGAMGGSMGDGIAASIDKTGPDSTNKITENHEMTTTVTNTNTLSVQNYVTQTATTGDVTVSRNTTAGGAMSGDASNSSSSTFSLSVSN